MRLNKKMQKTGYAVSFSQMARSFIFISILFLLCRLLNFMYMPPAYDYRAVLYNIYNAENIDYLYLGSSHVYTGVNPAILDQLNGKNNFNLATPGQRVNGSYYLLKEVDKENELSHVFLEVFYMHMVEDNFNNDKDPIDEKLYFNEQVADNMKFSVNKLLYILSSAGIESYAEFFFPFSRYQKYYLDYNYIKDNITAKNEDKYLQYRSYDTYADGNGMYEFQQNNYCYNTREFLDETRFAEQFRILDEEPVGRKTEKYIMRIIEYCRQHDIELTLYIPPVDDIYLICTENYDNYLNQIEKIAEENEIQFYDFNLVKEQYLSIPREGFSDYAHTNDIGASIFTPFFWETVSNTSEKNESCFYSSYEEKLASLQPAIYGMYYLDIDDETGTKRYVTIASNRSSKNMCVGGQEYQIILSPDNGEAYMLQDFSGNMTFTITPQDHGLCTIHMRDVNTMETIQTLQVRY